MSARAPEAEARVWEQAAADLHAGLARLGLEAPAEPLLAYLRLLARWNRAYNLTSVDEPRAMVTHHLLDSLAVMPAVEGPRVLDVGTGAGLPGIPLALALPACDFTLLDSNSKKTRFVTQAVLELGLRNVTVVHQRVEEYRPPTCFNTVVARAYAALGSWLAQTRIPGCPGGLYLAMKGVFPAAELEGLPEGFVLEGVTPLEVPGLAAARHLVRVRKSAAGE